MKNIPLLALILLSFQHGVQSDILHAQMLNPSIDREDEPFSYFSQPTDVIGVMDGREATLVTPEGYLYTGFGELMFFTGDPPEPVRQRVKTLLRGYLPVVEYKLDRDGIRYAVSMFAATLDGNAESPLMNFIRVKIQNRAKEQRTACFAAGVRFQNDVNTPGGVGDNRFRRPATASYPGGYEQAGVLFNPEWEYGFLENAFLRDGKVMYLFPSLPAPQQLMTLKTGYNEPGQVKAGRLAILPTTPVGIVQYRLSLKAHQEQTLEFAMPYEPVPPDAELITPLRGAHFADYLGRTIDFWERLFDRGIDIDLPEEKVVQTFKANLVYDLIARNKVDSLYIQKVNEFQYDAFWLRDASSIVRMYDLSGYHDIARQCLDFFSRWQQPDGNFVSQGGQFDGWGQSLWAYGQHYRITRDAAFAESVYPSVRRAVEWLQQARLRDPLRVVPATTPGDNEDISGHVTGHNFWALAGLKNAIALAEGLNKKEDSELFKREYDDFRATLVGHLRRITAGTGGYIPPGLDSLGGQDWGNMLSVYPECILDPSDSMVTATIDTTRAKYQEGIMTYGDGRWLHHYLTMKNTETEVIRGDQETALQELYALLVHTSSTHAGFEFAIRPWSTRDFGLNLAPHGGFSATFRALLRNMLVREQGDQLHLLSCISPEWVKDGSIVTVHRAPTNFGHIDLELHCHPGGATLKISNRYRLLPEMVVLHIPFWVELRGAKADGKVLTPVEGTLKLPLGARSVDLFWKNKPGVKPMSYKNSVQDFKREYRERFNEFLKNGN